MLMMRPKPRSRMPSMTGRVMLKSELRFVLMTAYHCSGVILWNMPVFGDAGVVDQNIHRAEVLRDLRQSGRAGLEAADVPLVGLHARFGLELRRRFVISV